LNVLSNPAGTGLATGHVLKVILSISGKAKLILVNAAFGKLLGA
jgi:hypothetical protein